MPNHQAPKTVPQSEVGMGGVSCLEVSHIDDSYDKNKYQKADPDLDGNNMTEDLQILNEYR